MVTEGDVRRTVNVVERVEYAIAVRNRLLGTLAWRDLNRPPICIGDAEQWRSGHIPELVHRLAGIG